MPDFVDVFFAPDIDNAWVRAPGALSGIEQFAPLQAGTYGTMGTSSLFSLTGLDYLFAKTFRQVDGSVRFLGFRAGNIDEYSSSGTRTNRLTSVTATSGWDAAAWGNQIIAVDLGVATQSSTGAGFTALGGSSPKARMIAANINFVMMGDVDDGGSNVYSDMVWWCGLRNPATWAPSASTLAGRQRLLDAPGPLRGLVAFRDSFVAFKDNAFFIGTPGGPYTFSWRMVSSKVGCIARQSISEIDGKLYWLHTSGFWEFDGSNLVNVGLPVFQSFLSENSYVSGIGGISAPGSFTLFDVTRCQSSADEVEGVVSFASQAANLSDNLRLVYYLYNCRSRKWGRYAHTLGNSSGSAYPVMVKTSTADMQSFAADKAGRLWAVWNSPTNATLRSLRYPAALSDSDTGTCATGVYGDAQMASKEAEWFLRHLSGSDALTSSDVSATVARYQNEDKNTTKGNVSLTFNSEFNSLQGTAAGKTKALSISYATGKKAILGGIAPVGVISGKR